MAFDNNAITLGEYALLSNDPVQMAITDSLYRTCNILKDIPLVTQKTLKKAGTRWLNGTGLPSVNWRKINELPTVTKGKPVPYEEQVMVLSNQIQIDRLLMEDENAIDDPIDTEIDGYMAAATYDINYKFLLNDPTSSASGNDEDSWAGLRYRLDNPGIYGIPTIMKVNGIEGTGSAIVATTAMSAANAQAFIASIQCVLDRMGVPDGEGVVMYCNDYFKRRLEWAVRALGDGAGFKTITDSFDRPVESYKRMLIRDAGYQADGTSYILGPETQTGFPNSTTTYTGTNQYASAYFVRYGKGFFTGWQMEPLKPVNLGLDPTNGVAYNVVVDWACGLWQPQNRCVARLFGVQIT